MAVLSANYCITEIYAHVSHLSALVLCKTVIFFFKMFSLESITGGFQDSSTIKNEYTFLTLSIYNVQEVSWFVIILEIRNIFISLKYSLDISGRIIILKKSTFSSTFVAIMIFCTVQFYKFSGRRHKRNIITTYYEDIQ